MSQTLQDHVIGTQLFFGCSLGTMDLSTLPITINMDSPTGARITLGYLDGYSDGVLQAGNTSVYFTKTSTWSAQNMTPGQWTVRFEYGDRATVQQEAGSATMQVVLPRGGILPVT